MNYSILAAIILLFAVSCKKEKTPEAIPADVKEATFSVNARYSGNYTFFSFASGATLPITDSATNKWDFAMLFDRIIINSNSSGPGSTEVQIVNQPFQNVTVAPEAGYKRDTSIAQLAIKPDWYSYDRSTNSFSPIAGKTFVFRTSTGNYAKMEFVTVDPTDANGNIVISPLRPTLIRYKIRFAYQSNASRIF